MTIYAYKCRTCGQRYESEERANVLHVECQTLDCMGAPTRDYSGIQVNRGMKEHWNPSVNAPVTSEKDYATKLRISGEQYTEKTGIETRYVPVDWSDTKALGITEEGLDATNKRRVDVEGLPPIRLPK